MNGIDKRSGIRMKREIAVGVRTRKGATETNLAYTIDLSRGGVKIGSPALYLTVGDPVELLVDKAGEKVSFAGHVVRKEGIHYIDRLCRSGNAFFIRIEDVSFTAFVAENFYL